MKATSVVEHLSSTIVDWEKFLPSTTTLNRELASWKLRALRSELQSALLLAASATTTGQPTSGETKLNSTSSDIPAPATAQTVARIEASVQENASNMLMIVMMLEKLGRALLTGNSGGDGCVTCKEKGQEDDN